jgi:hypothetical protein
MARSNFLLGKEARRAAKKGDELASPHPGAEDQSRAVKLSKFHTWKTPAPVK